MKYINFLISLIIFSLILSIILMIIIPILWFLGADKPNRIKLLFVEIADETLQKILK